MVFRPLLKPENTPEPSRNNSLMASSTTVKPHHQPLHNFPLQDLKWSINNSNNNNNSSSSNNNNSNGSSANQNHPRVRKSSSSSDHSEKKKSVGCGDDVAAEEKGKIFIRLKANTNNNNNNGGGKSSDDVALEEEFLEAKTWNLRPRKAVVKPGPARTELTRSDVTQSELTRAKSGGEVRASGEKKKVEEEKKKQKFSISLSKEEIEEDVFALTGSKPVRRPKKRARHVQKCLDSVFPGLWLASITPDSYRVDPPTKG